MKKTLYALSIVAIAFTSSCKKDDPAPATSSKFVAGDYYPTTKNSTWSYEGTGSASSYTAVVTGDTTIDNKVYAVLETTQGGTTNVGMLRKSNGNYEGYSEFPGAGMTTMIFLKDNAAVGATWYTDIDAGIIKYRYLYRMVAKGISKTVKGKAFSNVIQVHLDTQVDYQGTGQYTTTNTTEYYYSKDIGLILSDFGATGACSITTYSIK